MFAENKIENCRLRAPLPGSCCSALRGCICYQTLIDCHLKKSPTRKPFTQTFPNGGAKVRQSGKKRALEQGFFERKC
jgi:hypothetical protein